VGTPDTEPQCFEWKAEPVMPKHSTFSRFVGFFSANRQITTH